MSTNIILFNKPLEADPVTCEVESGTTIGSHFPDISDQVEVVVNDRVLERCDYDKYLLKDTDSLYLMRFPAGDTDTRKAIARTVLIIGVQVGAAVLTAGLSTVASAAIVAASTVAASYGLNAIGLVPTPDISAQGGDITEFRRRGALTGSQNQLVPYAPVPRVYGHTKLYPMMAAKPFTSVNANVQYLHLLFNLGAGPIRLSSPKIGNTSIGSFDSNNNFTSNGNFENVDIDVAENPQHYTNDVFQEAVNVPLNGQDDQGIRTSAADCEEATVGFVFPNGLFEINRDNGDIESTEIAVTIEYKKTSESQWHSTNGYKTATQCNQPNPGDPSDPGRLPQTPVRIEDDGIGSCQQVQTGDPAPYIISNDGKETFRAGVTFSLPDKGQYDIRVTRLTPEAFKGNDDPQADNIIEFDQCTWTNLKSITFQQPTSLPGTVQIGMKIKATDQLTGVLDTFSVQAESRLSYYDGSIWQHPTFDPNTGTGTGGKLTNKPAWIIADMFCNNPLVDDKANNGGILSYSDLDADSFKYWADTYPDYTYNGVIDDQATVAQAANSVAAAGRASMGNQDGLWAPIIDEPNQQPAGLLTDRNTADFHSTLVFPEELHGIRVKFRDEDNDYNQTQKIVFADGYSKDGTDPHPGDDTLPPFPNDSGGYDVATKFTDVVADGITDWTQIHRLYRFQLARRVLRPATYTKTLDAENLRFTRGDKVLSAASPVLHGGGSGRIKDVTRDGSNNVTAIQVDDNIEMIASENYYLYIQKDTGDVFNFQIVTDEGSHNIVEPVAPEPMDIDGGELFSFGVPAPLKIVAIKPGPDLTATLEMVDESPAIYDADTEPIPPYDPNITIPANFDDITPPSPEITGIRSDDSALYQDDDGSYRLRLLVDFIVDNADPTLHVECRYRTFSAENGWVSVPPVDVALGVVSIGDVIRGKEYVVQLRSRYKNNVSGWVQASTSHKVEGKKINPPDVTGFSAEVDKTLVRLRWDEVLISDLAYYEVRKGADWDTGSFVDKSNRVMMTDEIKTSGDVTYWIKAVDTHGNYSINATSVTVGIDNKYTDDPVYPTDGSFMNRDFSNVSDWTPADNRFLNASNNLSDLADVPASLINLGLGPNDNVNFGNITGDKGVFTGTIEAEQVILGTNDRNTTSDLLLSQNSNISVGGLSTSISFLSETGSGAAAGGGIFNFGYGSTVQDGSESYILTLHDDRIRPRTDIYTADDYFMTGGNVIRTDNYIPQSQGFSIDYGGNADFRTIYADEMVVEVFTANITQALAGSDILTKSVATLDQSFTIPNESQTVSITVRDLQGLDGFQVFESGDWVFFQVVQLNTSPAVILNIWGTVSNYSDNADGTQTWDFLVDYAGLGDNGVGRDVNAGAIGLDYGVSGDAYIERTVLDRASGSDFSKVPYDRIVRWTGSDPRTGTHTVVNQRGNVNGLADYTTETYGWYSEGKNGDKLTIDPDSGIRFLDNANNVGSFFENGTFFLGAGDPAASQGYTNQQIDAVEIGGRNIWKDTSESNSMVSWSDRHFDYIGHGFAFLTSPILAGQTYTVSAFIESNGGGQFAVFMEFLDSAGVRTSFHDGNYVTSEGPTTVTATADPDAASVDIGFRNPSASGNMFVVYSRVKLETGNKDTAWTPAPEDQQAAWEAKADAAQDNLAFELGYSDYQALVSDARANGTLFAQGGFLNVSDLIETNAIVTNMLAAGSVTASKIQVSDFSNISGTTLSGFTLTPSEIKATHGNRLISMFQDSTTSWFRIEPDTTQGAGFDFVGMFSKDNGTWGLRGRKNGNYMFQLGSTNQIAAWEFDDKKLIRNFGNGFVAAGEYDPDRYGLRIEGPNNKSVSMQWRPNSDQTIISASDGTGNNEVVMGNDYREVIDFGMRVRAGGTDVMKVISSGLTVNGRIEGIDGFLQNMDIDGTLTMSSLGQIVMEGSSVIKNDSFSMQAGHSSGENPYKIEFLYSGATGIGAAAIYGDEVELYIDAFTPNPQDYGRINIRGFISQPVHDGGTVSGSFGTVTLSKPVLAVIGDGSPRINRIEYDSGSPRDGDIVTFINYGNGSGVIFDSSAIAGSSNPNIKIPGPSGAEYTLPQDSAVKWIHYNTHWYRLR